MVSCRADSVVTLNWISRDNDISWARAAGTGGRPMAFPLAFAAFLGSGKVSSPGSTGGGPPSSSELLASPPSTAISTAAASLSGDGSRSSPAWGSDWLRRPAPCPLARGSSSRSDAAVLSVPKRTEEPGFRASDATRSRGLTAAAPPVLGRGCPGSAWARGPGSPVLGRGPPAWLVRFLSRVAGRVGGSAARSVPGWSAWGMAFCMSAGRPERILKTSPRTPAPPGRSSSTRSSTARRLSTSPPAGSALGLHVCAGGLAARCSRIHTAGEPATAASVSGLASAPSAESRRGGLPVAPRSSASGLTTSRAWSRWDGRRVSWLPVAAWSFPRPGRPVASSSLGWVVWARLAWARAPRSSSPPRAPRWV
mmetsp:Transcript_63372/g.145770  ORF Transcript_63372/g.145770 Transcript_63372/m.145770 type:complete len:366 (-) Transcript_63372:1662-2759(-)